MNVSHFILGIHFCTANGHNYVAKRKGAINKTELSTKFCRKPSATASPSMAWGKSKRYLKESHEKGKAKYQFGLYSQERPVGVRGTTAAVVWGLHGIVAGHLQGQHRAVHSPSRGFSPSLPRHTVLRGYMVRGACLPAAGGLAVG